MNRFLIILLILGFSCLSSLAEETNLLAAMSPKLKKLVTANPSALTVLSNACSSAFRTNTITLNYFYSEDDAKARALHYYPHVVGQGDVVLCIRENQQPWDEFMSIVYELLNSKNESRFEALFERAKSGSVSREEFATAINRVEFETDLAMRDIVKRLELTSKEKSQSYFYNRVLGCPGKFEDFLIYQRKVSPKRNLMEEYEKAYDALLSK